QLTGADARTGGGRMKRLAFYAVVIVATLALLILLWQFRSAVILLLLSLVLTAALRPSVDYLESRGLGPGLARVLIYLALFGLLGLALYLIAAPLLAEFQRMSNFLVVLYDFTYRSWSAKTGIQQAIVQSLPAPGDLDQTMAGPAGAAVL